MKTQELKLVFANKRIAILAVLAIFVFGVGPVYAQSADAEQIVVNSGDWIDVYSAMCYANLNGLESKFVNSPAQGKTIVSVLDPSKLVYLIQSANDPIIAGYKSNLESEGFTVSSVTTSDSGKELNLALAEKVDTAKYIIIDDSYGYNAISVAPYSIASHSCVLVADSENIDEVYTFLKGRTVEDVIIYGRVDREVREKLGEFNPEIIDNGDRFKDNLAIVDKYVALKSPTQIVLTNGEFIEDAIMSGNEPVIFLGRNVVPEDVVEYVKAHGFNTGVVIGNDLTGAATRLKDRTDMSIFIKFGQGRSTEGGFAIPEVLDMFYLPYYELSLDIVSGNYNVKTKTVEIVYQNPGKTGAFAKATIDISAGDESVATIGDDEPFFIDTATKFGRAYGADLSEWADDELQAHIYLEYGETRKSLTELVEKDLILGLLEFDDQSKLSVTSVKYDTKLERLMLDLKNTGQVTCYADAWVELKIEGESEPVMFTPTEIKGETELSKRIKLSPADLAENPTVGVHIRYGERSDMRLKTIDEVHPLTVVSGYPVAIIAAAVLVVVIIVGLLLWKRRKK